MNVETDDLSMDTDDAIEKVEAAPKRGRPRGSTRAQGRETNRDPVRGGAVVVRGRDGEVLTRKRTGVGDIFDVPADLIPAGWSYQWCAVTVVGNTEVLIDQNLMMAENGWRPVPSDRYPGRFMPVGHKGPITRGGQMLMERPEALTEEARSEDIRAAKQLISDRNDSLKLSGLKKGMAPGFEMSKRYRNTGGDVRLSIDPGLDIPTPQHQLADE